MHQENLGRDNRLCVSQLLEQFIRILARIELFVQQNYCW
jgi:hypothetical protein